MSSIEKLKNRFYDINAIYAAQAIMDWDQQCYMPRGGAGARAEQSSILSRIGHEMLVSKETQDLTAACRGEVAADSVEAAMLRVVQRQLDQQLKIPSRLVEERSRVTSLAHELWVEARKNNDFASFAPTLEKVFDLTREVAECLGYSDHIYDPLIDMSEEGFTAKDCQQMFDTIREPLVDLVAKIKASPNQVDDSFFVGEWDKEQQRLFTEQMVQKVGFSFERGRQDVAPHPFCTNFSISDVRLTTRYLNHLASAIMSSMHEAGHGMYEQGSPMEWDRTPLAGGVSLGIHESQSRLWENIVGRSRPFWSHFLPTLQKHFPSLSGVSAEQFYRGINKVQPSFIRVEADEVTYNLHIMIRFEIECAVLSKELAVKDIPAVWNEKIQSYFGLSPKSDSEGCLQDVHWSAGLIGYFPTYTVGNLLSYQIWKALKAQVPNTDALMESGDFGPIFNWLRENIYAQGQRYTPKELVQRVTGKPMSADDLIAGLTGKYSEIYGL